MSHTVEITEFHLAVDNLSKLISATVAGMVGNVPGILQAVSGLTFDLCSSSEDKSDSEAFIKDIVDNDGNKGILVLRASSETKTKKKFWGKNEKKMQVDGVIFVLIPLSEDAKQQCINIENKHASNVLDQIERDFFWKQLFEKTRPLGFLFWTFLFLSKFEIYEIIFFGVTEKIFVFL